MSWECHRCHRVLNDLTPACNCPPPTVVATGTGLAEMMVEAARAVARKPDATECDKTTASTDLHDAREAYFAAGGQESDIGPRLNAGWYWRRASKLLVERIRARDRGEGPPDTLAVAKAWQQHAEKWLMAGHVGDASVIEKEAAHWTAVRFAAMAIIAGRLP